MAAHRLAHCRLLAIDYGARYTGLAVRTCRMAGAEPYALLERTQHQHQQPQKQPQQRGAAALGEEWRLHFDARRRGRQSPKAASSSSSSGSDGEPMAAAARLRGGFPTQAAALAAVIEAERIAACVVGMPFHADGSRSRECAIVERHAEHLLTAISERGTFAFPPHVLFWDESFSTRRAVGSRRPKDMGSRAARGSHAAAACIILEEVLEELFAQEALSNPLDTLLERVSSDP